MHFFVGTSGYSYKQWKGPFYPEKLSDKELLKFYGTKLNSVEINNTFYQMPKEAVLKNWADQVPKGFAFSIKASQRITHIKRLNDVGGEVEYLIRTARILGEKLGVLLFQLPPNMKKDTARLEAFFKPLSGDARIAFEFRHESWFDDETFNVLRANNASLCIADVDDDGLHVPFTSTANWGYLRLRREQYTPAELKTWHKKVSEQPWKTAFIFFKHEDEGIAPALARQFLTLGKQR